MKSTFLFIAIGVLVGIVLPPAWLLNPYFIGFVVGILAMTVVLYFIAE